MTDSEYLCLLCGENEASHEYCDGCLKTLRGDYVVASAPADAAGCDWVVHITEEQEQYGYVTDAVESMLSSGRERVMLWSGSKAAAAPEQRAPSSVPALGAVDPLQVLVDGTTRPLSSNWWDELSSLVASGREELIILATAADTGVPNPIEVRNPGPRRRPSALAG